jgi:hypothetical protein
MTILSQLEKSVVRLACTGCGAEAVATCSCHKAYKPIDAAVAAVKANPGKSNRAIAEEAGISEGTIRNARKSGAQDYAPDEREGRDGKTYSLPTPKAPDTVKEINGFHREIISEVGELSGRLTRWLDADPPLDDDGRSTLLNALDLAITDLRNLFKRVEGTQ